MVKFDWVRRFKVVLALLAAIVGIGLSVPNSAGAVMATPYPGSFAMHIEGTNIYANAWNNGPYIATYDQFSDNDALLKIAEPGGYYAFQYSNSGGPYYAGYIGDYQNNQYDARAAVNVPGSGIPWGGLFTEVACPGGHAYKNNHWGGWLGPSTPTQNGGAWYLNNNYEFCFNFQAF